MLARQREEYSKGVGNGECLREYKSRYLSSVMCVLSNFFSGLLRLVFDYHRHAFVDWEQGF